ncbi:hypothetical protein EV714DRAFT_271335 [Schizophyllum commune]
MARADSPLLGLQDEPCPPRAADSHASGAMDALYNPSRYLTTKHASATRRGGSGHSPASSISSISAVSTDTPPDSALPSPHPLRQGASSSSSHLSTPASPAEDATPTRSPARKSLQTYNLPLPKVDTRSPNLPYHNRVKRLSSDSDARSSYKTSPRSAKTHSISPSISSIVPPSLSSHSPSPSVSSSIVTPRSRSSSFRNAVYVMGVGDTMTNVTDAGEPQPHKGTPSSVLRNVYDLDEEPMEWPTRPRAVPEDDTPRQSLDSDDPASSPRRTTQSPRVGNSRGLPTSPRPAHAQVSPPLQAAELNWPLPPPSAPLPSTQSPVQCAPARPPRPQTLKIDDSLIDKDVLTLSPSLRRMDSPSIKLSTPTFASTPRAALRRQSGRPSEPSTPSQLAPLRESPRLGSPRLGSREPTSSCYSADPVDPFEFASRATGRHFRPESLAEDDEADAHAPIPIPIQPLPSPLGLPPQEEEPEEHAEFPAGPAASTEGDYMDEIADSYFDSPMHSPMHSPAISRKSSRQSMARSAQRSAQGHSDSLRSFPSRWNDDELPSPSTSYSNHHHRLASQPTQPEHPPPSSRSVRNTFSLSDMKASSVTRPSMRPRASTSKLMMGARQTLAKKPMSPPIFDHDAEDYVAPLPPSRLNSRPSTASSKNRGEPPVSPAVSYAPSAASHSIPPSPFSITTSLASRSPGPSTPHSIFEDHGERPKTRERSNTLEKFKNAVRARKRSLIASANDTMKLPGDLPPPPKSAKDPVSSQWYADDDDQKNWLSSLRKIGRNNKSSVWS